MADAPAPDSASATDRKWIYPEERARLLRQHADTLERLLKDIARSPHATAVLPSSTLAAGQFMTALLAKCIQADGHRTGGELALVQEYFRDGGDIRDNDDWVRNVRDADRQLTALRPFLAVAMVHDARSGTGFMQHIALLVADMAALIVTSDAHTAAAEGRFVAELVNEIVESSVDEEQR